MKLRNLAIAAATLFAGAAHAQSSVTLYGLIDESIVYTNSQKGASNVQLNSGTLSTSRWGLRGREDLGGGLYATFLLENGFDASSGKFKNGGDIFGRQAYVGLGSDQYGTLTLGRQYDFVVDYVAPNTAVAQGWGGNFAAHPYDNDNLANDMRLNNSVKFSSISFNGFKAGAMYAFSNQAGGFGNNGAWSAGASYANGPINLGAAYVQINRSTVSPNATGAASTADGDSLTTGGRQQIYGVSGKYTFGPAAVGLAWTHSSTNNITSIFQGGGFTNVSGNNLKFDNFEINGRYFVSPAFSLGVAYTYTMGQLTSATGHVDPHWHQVVAQADYALSKRTDVYLEGIYQRVGGTNGLAVFSPGVFTQTPSSTNEQTVVAVGLRHRF
jgi:general bacterial porin, GBP family